MNNKKIPSTQNEKNDCSNPKEMFGTCSSLRTIYVFDFNTDKATVNYSMFYNSKNIRGQNGTTYNSSYTDKTYARIDTPETPGYFTYKAKAAA